MIFQKCLMVACIFNLMGVSVQAAPIPQSILDEATAKVATDSTLLSGWTTSQLKYVVPFNSTAGNVVPSQLKIFGLEVGVEGVVSGTKLDIDGFRNLPTTLVNTNTIDMFSRMPFPLILGHAKIGLPFGFDAGIRLGGIPEKHVDKDNSQFRVKNKVIGFDLRKKVIEEGAMKPFGLTMGLNYTHADGSMDITNTFDALPQTIEGHTVTISNGLTTGHADWKTNSVGLQAILDKQIFIITPYIGASVNRNSGDINSSITTTGTASAPDFPGDTQNLTATGLSTDKANKWDVRALAGFELTVLPFVKLGFQGEYAGNKNVAGALGLRIQFR